METRRSRSKSFLLMVLIGIALSLLLSQVFFAISVDYFQFDLQMPTGERGVFTFEVTNDEPEATEVTIYLGDWDITPSGELRFFEPGTLPRSAADWISVSPSRFRLEKGEAMEVRFAIDVPHGVEGTYWAMIFAESSPRPVVEEGETTVTRTMRVGIQIMETPAGTEERDGRITDIDLLSLDPLMVTIDFENTGNVRLRPEGRLEIRDTTGETVRNIPIEEFLVLPGGKRCLSIVDREGRERLPPGRYIALGIIDFGGDFLVAGQISFEVG
jgi:hypothetical protein